MKASDLLESESIENNYWNIGERAVFTPSDSIETSKVEVSVIDVDTNSVIMTGILQNAS